MTTWAVQSHETFDCRLTLSRTLVTQALQITILPIIGILEERRPREFVSREGGAKNFHFSIFSFTISDKVLIV